MKKIIMPNSIKQINNLNKYYDGVIIGLRDYSVNMPVTFSMEDIKEITKICKNNNKEVFIALNKNMQNKDIPYLKDILKEIDTFNIEGILYYDIALVNLKDELKINTPLVWSQEHLTTNYLTCDFWNMYGAKYVYLSSEITLDEINEIAENTKALTMVNMFGYLPMFVSKRHLVKNYLDTFNIKDDSKINYLYKENYLYQIIDSDLGTIAYSHSVLNGIQESLDIKTDYIVLNSFSIPDDIFSKVVEMFYTVDKSNVLEYKERIDSMLDTDLGFLYKETIYKVK